MIRYILYLQAPEWGDIDASSKSQYRCFETFRQKIWPQHYWLADQSYISYLLWAQYFQPEHKIERRNSIWFPEFKIFQLYLKILDS